MSRTDYDEVFDGQGNLLSRTPRQVSDRDDERDKSLDRIKQSYIALRQWSDDAQAAYDDWPTKTQAQKDAAIRETIRRLGIFFDRFADFLLMQDLDG